MTVACLLFCCLGSDIYIDFFERGNAAYAGGSMAEAVNAYEQLAASGVENPEVFYNLANAYHHLGDPGRAVLNYERAIGLDPGFDAARRNLAFAVGKTVHQLPRPPDFAMEGREMSWISGVPQRYFRLGLAGFWWLLWGILVAVQRRALPANPKAVAAVWGMLVLCAAAWALPIAHPRAAVVTVQETAMRYGPDPRDAVRFVLATGDRVAVDSARGAWVRVETAPGDRGWVERDSLTDVGPPFTPE